MHNFRELQVWLRSMQLVKEIYEITSSFPNDEKYGMTTQIRRCAVSIPSNIAEGSGRKSDKDFSNFLSISLGSQFELETQLLLSLEIKLVSEKIVNKIINELKEIQKMTRALIEKFSV